MGSLLAYLLGAMAVSFLCSVLEAVLMSTPISYITMREEEGYKPATRFKEYKQNASRPIAAILSLNTIANTIGAAGVGHQATVVFGSGADYYLIARNSKGPSAEYDVISCEGADTLTFYDKDVTKGRAYYYMVLGQKGDDDVVGKYYGSKYKVKVS